MTTMSTHVIPRRDWNRFFDTFSRQHEGWLVTLSQNRGSRASYVEVHGMPLEGITADHETPVHNAITVMLGGCPSRHITHTIHDASLVRLEQVQTEVGLAELLEIESVDGTTTSMRFGDGDLHELLDVLV